MPNANQGLARQSYTGHGGASDRMLDEGRRDRDARIAVEARRLRRLAVDDAIEVVAAARAELARLSAVAHRALGVLEAAEYRRAAARLELTIAAAVEMWRRP